MKRIMISLLVTAMTLSMIGCGNTTNENNTAPNTTETATNTESAVPETTTAETEPSATIADTTVAEDANASGESVGTVLNEHFLTVADENPDATAMELATALCEHPLLADTIGPVTMEVTPGLLNGFDNAEVTGFEEGVMFAPMIGSIPFVGYVFTFPKGQDVEGFISFLQESANPRWNVCTEADETIVSSSGSKVFFLMSPKTFEE